MTAPNWLANYDDGIPSTLEPYPNRTLTDYLREAGVRWLDLPALLFKGSTTTYRKLEDASNALAAALKSPTSGKWGRDDRSLRTADQLPLRTAD